MSTPFLQQVARAYVENEGENLLDYCFVFPNKRAGVFFNKYIAEEIGQTFIAPATTTISDFITSLSPWSEASRYELLFLLYKAYTAMPGVDIEFDTFLFWGDMLINDFNDVDRYMVDAEKLFVNVTRLREISSNYLTDEQREVIRRFWGEDFTQRQVDDFWEHVGKEDDYPRHGKFLKLWEVLYPLYKSFRATLEERGLATQGMMYRNAADAIRNGVNLPYRRYIFVGFNVLSTSELKIFSRLQARGIADFYWDYNSPMFRIDGNRASRFIENNIKEFPSLYDIDAEPNEEFPNVEIIGVSSNTGQVKLAGQLVKQMIADKEITNPDNAVNTAIVLPDESLFIQLIHSIPEEITSLNVTMGFPMRLSPIAALIHKLVSLQRNKRKVDGNDAYFIKDLNALLNSSALRSIDSATCKQTVERLNALGKFSVEAKKIIEIAPEFECIFRPIPKEASLDDVKMYLLDILDFVEASVDEKDLLQRHFLNAYRDALNMLCESARYFDVKMHSTTVFHMVERSVNSESINFVGEPLKGLQVMGVLETRSLDFNNVIMLSMNERIFPRKLYTNSFIPDALRRGYGMATIDFQESIFAYYFYRLISRAKNVKLLYDARKVKGSRSSEMSRYLTQLLYIFPDGKARHTVSIFTSKHFPSPEIIVNKSPRVMQLLNRFRTEGSGKNLSASAINSYINCPLEFYLEYVEGYTMQNEIVDYMDSSTFGTIVHNVAQRIYQGFQDKDLNPVTINRADLEALMQPGNVTIQTLITEEINSNYNKVKDLHTPLLGESLVLGRIMERVIHEMLKIDITFTPFTFVAAEKNERGYLELAPGIKVNFKQKIDRVDIVDGRMRFIDYKTGTDKITTTGFNQLMDNTLSDRRKAMLQLLLYCYAHKMLNCDNQPIQPMIYPMMKLAKDKKVAPISIGKPIEDYHDFEDEFKENIAEVISSLFNPEMPFIQTTNEHNCKFCNFKAICGRKEIKTY